MGLLDLFKKEDEDLKDLRDEDILVLSVDKPELFRFIIRRHEKAFLRKAQTILPNTADAEDALQETFVKIYKAAGKFEEVEGAKFTSWAYKILINTSITKYHSIKRHRMNTVNISPEMEAVVYDLDDIKKHEAKLDKDYFLSISKDLPELLKRTVTLCTVEGLTYKEVAELEDVSEGVIRTRLHRARILLKDKHKENYE